MSNFLKLWNFWLNWSDTVCTLTISTYIISNFTCVSNANSSDQRPKAAYSDDNYCDHMELIELMNFEEVTFVELKKNVRGFVMDCLEIV